MQFIIKKRSKLFVEIITEWLNKKEKIKLQTYQKYSNTIHNYIQNNIGMICIKKINEEVIKSFFENLEKNKVSKSIQKTILYIIKSSIQFGYDKKYCKKLNLDEVKVSRNKVKIEILTIDEQRIIENYLKSNINIRKLCVLLCLYTGLRVGEVSGLKWEDIDLDNKTLEVKRTIQRVKNNNTNIKSKTILIESTPKSETSKRIIPIAAFLIPLLKKFKTDDNFYLLSNSEKLYDPRLLESFFKTMLRNCNIKNKKFHILRHTFATRSVEAKMDIKTLSELLGHSSIEITLKLYVHPSIDLKKNSIENVVNFVHS